MNTDYYLFLVTVPNLEEGKSISRILVEQKLAVCVNIIRDIFSVYEWNEEIREENELLLIIKTTENKSRLLMQKINEIHSYDTPECIGFKIEKGLEKYLKWISDTVNQTK